MSRGTSRAEYFKERRETRKTFSVVLDRKFLDKFEAKLSEQGITKTEWLKARISEYLSK